MLAESVDINISDNIGSSGVGLVTKIDISESISSSYYIPQVTLGISESLNSTYSSLSNKIGISDTIDTSYYVPQVSLSLSDSLNSLYDNTSYKVIINDSLDCTSTSLATATTTSNYYSWYNSGGGGAPLSPSGSGSELVTSSSTEASPSLPNVITEVQKVSNWLVSRSGRAALLFFGFLLVVGLVLISGSKSRSKRGVRGGGRRRR